MEPVSRSCSRERSCVSESTGRTCSSPEHSRSKRSEQSTSRYSHCSNYGEYTSDQLYAKGYHVDLEDVQDALVLPPGSEIFTPTTGKDPETCTQRVKLLILKRKSKVKELYKQLRACANNQVRFEEFKKNNPENDTTLTQWANTHGKFKIPKCSCYSCWKHKRNVDTCALYIQGHPCALGSFYQRACSCYTWEEENASHRSSTHVRTVDLTPEDQAKQEEAYDISDRKSDWLDRNGVPI